MKRILCSAAALCAFGAFGANLAFNGSFKLGTTGYALERFIDVKNNPDLKFEPLEIVPGPDGKAILIRNKNGDKFSFFSKEYRLQKNVKYKFSMDLKGSASGQKLSIYAFKVDRQWSADGTTFTLTPEWKKYSYTFPARHGDGYYHFLMRPETQEPQTRIGDFYVANVRIEAIDDASADKVEASAVPEKTLYYKGDTAKITLKAYQPGKTAFSKKITVSVRDEYLNTVLARETIKLDLKPGEAKEIALKGVNLTRFGGYRVTVDDKDILSHDGFFASIGKYHAGKIDIARDFVVGFNDGLNADNLPPESMSIFYHLYNNPFEERFRLFSELGCRVLRDHGGGVRGVDWSSVQRRQEKFDFTHLDRQMALYRKYNIELFPVFGEGHIERVQSYRNVIFPEWVKLAHATDNPPNCGKDLQPHIVIPDDAQYYNFLYETAKHLQGKVPYYEITNEPNLYLSPKNYVHELKIAHDAIRKADPAAKISGFCLTSDFSATAMPWMKECVRLGGLKYVDAIGFHPYAGRTLSALHPADAYIADLRAEMKSYGKPDMPLWNTELYYLIDQQVKHNSNAENNCKVHHCLWRFLVDLGENVVQSIAIPGHFVWKRMLTPNMEFHGSNYHELIPSEIFVGYNTMARLFEGAKPVARHKLPNGVICYVYRKDGKLIAAVWSYLGRGVYADFSKFQVMDLFGNADKAERKVLKDAPYYLTPGKLSDAEFLNACKNLSITLDQPLIPGEYLRIAGEKTYFTLYNESGNAITGDAGLSGKAVVAKKIVKFTVPAHGKAVIELPVKVKNDKVRSVELMIVVNKNVVRFPVKVLFNKPLSGKIDMPNVKGTISFGSGRITVRGKVADATDAGGIGDREWWKTDCVELFFDLDPLDIPVRHAQTYTKKTFRLFINPRDAKKLHVMGNISENDCRVSVKPEADGYSFEAVINAKTGKVLGFDLKLDDAPGKSGKTKEFQLGSGERLHCNRCNFCIAK